MQGNVPRLKRLDSDFRNQEKDDFDFRMINPVFRRRK